jgi:hypothetical protein
MIDEIVPQDWEEALWLSNMIRSKLNEHKEQPDETTENETRGQDSDDIIF